MHLSPAPTRILVHQDIARSFYRENKERLKEVLLIPCYAYTLTVVVNFLLV